MSGEDCPLLKVFDSDGCRAMRLGGLACWPGRVKFVLGGARISSGPQPL